MKGKGSGIDGQKTYNKAKRGDIGIQNLPQKTKDDQRESNQKKANKEDGPWICSTKKAN